MTRFEDVMIIGAGSGNDVTAALMNGAKRLDAVEIDPAINQIGKNDHQELRTRRGPRGVTAPRGPEFAPSPTA